MQSYGPLGEPQKLVEVDPDLSPSRFPLPAPAQRLVVMPSATEASPLVPPMLRPGPGSAARFIFLYTFLTWLATLALNFPWLPWLLYLDYGFPIFRGVVPVWWLYMQTANFTFWNVLGVVAQDDYFTHDCVDALRRLGVPHDRNSRLYRWACGWWPHDFPKRCAVVTAVWTALFGCVPLFVFLITPPYHREHCTKLAFVSWVTGWSSSVGAALVTIVQVRAAGEGTSSPFYLKTSVNGRDVCFQSTVFKMAWTWSGAEHELDVLTRPPSHNTRPFGHQL